MSEASTLVSARHFDYIRARTTPEDAFQAELKQAARAAGIPPIWIAPEQAALLQILLRASRADEVVEVGTLAGSTAIVMARALEPGGRVRTIEADPKHARFAREWVHKAQLGAREGRVEVYEGKGADVLRTFAANSADAAFLDADKASYGLYLEECLRIVRPGGLIMVDNAFAFGQLFDERPTDRETPAVRAFNETMAQEARLQKVIVPIGDGMWVGVVL